MGPRHTQTLLQTPGRSSHTCEVVGRCVKDISQTLAQEQKENVTHNYFLQRIINRQAFFPKYVSLNQLLLLDLFKAARIKTDVSAAIYVASVLGNHRIKVHGAT